MTSATQIKSLNNKTILSLQQYLGNIKELFPTSLSLAAVEIKVNNPHANLEKTINSKESPAKAKTKILEEDEGKQFKTDHLEKLPKPNPSHVGSMAAVKPETPPLTSNSRAGKHDGHPKLIGAISKDGDDIETIL